MKESAMNDCPHVQRLGAYHDGELSGEARAQIEQHLRQCPACTAELRRLGRLSELLSAATATRIPPAALRRLHQGLDAVPMSDLRRVAEVCGAIAASILLVCSIYLVKTQPALGPIPLWETVAVARQEPPTAAPEEQLGQWIVEDLSGKNGHDQN
jgi:anti-sigma factor RsiW